MKITPHQMKRLRDQTLNLFINLIICYILYPLIAYFYAERSSAYKYYIIYMDLVDAYEQFFPCVLFIALCFVFIYIPLYLLWCVFQKQ